MRKSTKRICERERFTRKESWSLQNKGLPPSIFMISLTFFWLFLVVSFLIEIVLSKIRNVIGPLKLFLVFSSRTDRKTRSYFFWNRTEEKIFGSRDTFDARTHAQNLFRSVPVIWYLNENKFVFARTWSNRVCNWLRMGQKKNFPGGTRRCFKTLTS